MRQAAHRPHCFPVCMPARLPPPSIRLLDFFGRLSSVHSRKAFESPAHRSVVCCLATAREGTSTHIKKKKKHSTLRFRSAADVFSAGRQFAGHVELCRDRNAVFGATVESNSKLTTKAAAADLSVRQASSHICVSTTAWMYAKRMCVLKFADCKKFPPLRPR